MKLLEVRAALRTASKTDLFAGDVHNMRAKQWIKENTTVFYLDWETNVLSGPFIVTEGNNFQDLYKRMAFGKCGVITPIPNVITDEFLFELVLREASIDDLKDTPRHIKLNRIYYIYADQKLTGPFFTDNSTTSLFLENLVAKKQIFVPNERQHFRKKEYQKTA
ncbi:hypothetical protein AAGV28_06965 [Flavobacterium sp. FZUC8N2.13]|uniref:Uncharacterized protein n=1 Tax=Flavobacterium zubiriense TaxID=3138075 RepID=A0ABV4TAP6_9FLAO